MVTIGNHNNLYQLLEKIERFQTAPGTDRQMVIPKRGRSPYKYALLLAICYAWEDEDSTQLMKSKIDPDELKPWFRMVLVSQFTNGFQKISTQIAQPLWRLAVTDKLWLIEDSKNEAIDVHQFANKKDSVKTITALRKTGVAHAVLTPEFKGILNNEFERSVLTAFLIAKIDQCRVT